MLCKCIVPSTGRGVSFFKVFSEVKASETDIADLYSGAVCRRRFG